jgi:ferredoxin
MVIDAKIIIRLAVTISARKDWTRAPLSSNSVHRISIVPELCTGCRACELVCSYHHEGVFSRRSSSIRVKKVERRGEVEITVGDVDFRRPSCDLCRGERIPLCVRFCAPGALRGCDLRLG